MRIIIAFSLLVYIIQTFISVTISGIAAANTHNMIPFLVMIPGTLSLIVALVFAADRVYFSQLRIKKKETFLVSLSLFTITLVLLLIGNTFTKQVNTIELVPHYLIQFIWFPFLIPLVERVRRRNVMPKIQKSTE